jgi:CDP-glucose 4,6-dehydratase
MNLNKIFKNKKVLITGHTGFKGSWLTVLLLELKANVVGVSIDAKKYSHYTALKLKKKIIDLRADITDLKKMDKIIKKHKPDFIFHLAAQSLILKSYSEPLNTWKTNVIGTLNLVEILKSLKNKCYAVIITSDKCYLNVEKNEGYKETDRLGGLDPYSASKASAELVVASQIKSFIGTKHKVRIATARAGNVIGGGDWSDNRIIPDYIKSIKRKKILKIRSPNSTRPWQHVLEPLYGYLELAAALKFKKNIHGQSFNFGPEKYANKTVLDVIKEMKKILLAGNWKIVKTAKNKGKEAKLLNLNCSKAKKILKWKSILNFKETIRMVASWYEYYNLNPKSVGKKTISQIKEYQNLRNSK